MLLAEQTLIHDIKFLHVMRRDDDGFKHNANFYSNFVIMYNTDSNLGGYTPTSVKYASL